MLEGLMSGRYWFTPEPDAEVAAVLNPHLCKEVS